MRSNWFMTLAGIFRRQPQARHFRIELEREDDERWIADIPELPGVTTYGRTKSEAICKAEALAFRVLADRLEHGEAEPEQPVGVTFALSV